MLTDVCMNSLKILESLAFFCGTGENNNPCGAIPAWNSF